MPVSLASQRDPFRGGDSERVARASTEDKLRIPQARVLRALFPAYPADPPLEWPLLTRSGLAIQAGYTTLSGSITRALNGICAGSSSGDPHLGLLARGLVEVVEIDVDGLIEVNYRITASGIRAFAEYITAGGKLPKVKDASICVNDRYKDVDK